MSWTHHVPWLFCLTRSHFWAQECLSFCFSLCLSHPDTCSDTSERIVGKISSGSLRKAPFFFFLASGLGNFGRTEWHSQTKLDHRPAICQTRLRQIPVCRGKKKSSFSSKTQWIKQKPTSSVLACKCGIWSKWNTCRQLNDKTDPFEFLLSLEFLNMIICCTLGYKPHPSPGNDSLPPQPTDAVYVALLLFILISKGMIEWLCGFSQEIVELCSMKSASSGDGLSWGDFHRQLVGNCMKMLVGH